MSMNLHDHIAEKSVIGAIAYTGEDALDAALLAGVTDKSFYHGDTCAAWKAIISLREASKAVDLPSIAGVMGKDGNLTELTRMVDMAVPAHVDHYIARVLDRELLRRIYHEAAGIVGSVEGAESAEELRSKAEFTFSNIRQAAMAEPSWKETVKRQMQRWEDAQASGCAGIPTGFEFIDKGFGGLMEAAFYVVSGKASACKTTLVRNIAENLAMRGIPVSVCTLEQTAEQVAGSVIGRVAAQSVWALNAGHRHHQTAWGKLIAAASKVVNWPLRVDDQDKTPTQLWSWARREISKHGAKLLVVDYLQALLPDQKYNSDEARISAYSACCRGIAKQLRTPIIVVSALSNDGHLRGSGMIGYDAWAHIRMARADDWGPTNLHYVAAVEKVRFGPELADTDLWLIGNEQRLEERKEGYEYPQNDEG